MKVVLITGGTGLVGKKLTKILLAKNYEVKILTRNPKNKNEYKWNISENYMDEKAFENTNYIINLAGTGIADKRWTTERKKELLESRTKSVALLHKYIATKKYNIEAFVSASAVGFYGDRKEELLTEESKIGDGFLAEICQQWETEIHKIEAQNIRTCIVRIGIVLDKKGGALPKIAMPIKMGVGAYIGNGKQYFPWIHINDICAIFIHTLENKNCSGIYNASAPNIITNKELSKAIATQFKMPFLPFPAPSFVLKTIMGEMANMVLMSTNTSAKKIINTGYKFQFEKIEIALQEIYKD